ncbi:hypothetical protein DL96DRAFT_1818030 [Flagelloscypha sp. PMI_526]|nr:hypothetical protein DL96DRAFT_1818030 [Flagelloscypha sp. PMI_526]
MQFANLLAFVAASATVVVGNPLAIQPRMNEISSGRREAVNVTGTDSQATIIANVYTGINRGGTAHVLPLSYLGAGCKNLEDSLNNHMRSIETFSGYYCDFYVGQDCTDSRAGITGYSYINDLKKYDSGRFAVLYDAASSVDCVSL